MDAIVPWRLPFRLQCWHANLSTKPPRRPPAGPEHHYVQEGHGVASSRQVLLPGQRKAQGVMNLPSALSLSPRVVLFLSLPHAFLNRKAPPTAHCSAGVWAT